MELQSKKIESCWWWLRNSNVYEMETVCCVQADGQEYYQHINNGDIGVRPALYIDLKQNAYYSYAGTVNSRGEVCEDE